MTRLSRASFVHRWLSLAGALFGLMLLATPAVAADAASKGSAAEERLVSMVLLLSAPRPLDEHTLGTIVSQGLGIDHSHDTNAQSFIVAKPPYYRVRLKSGSYVISTISTPYFGPTDASTRIDDAAERRVIAQHRAWLSIDWLADDGTTDLRPVYQDIGRMAAALARSDTLAVYCPDMDHLALYSPATAETLRSNDPLRAFVGMPAK